MNRIFYIHSNILSICSYQTVKEALAKNEKIIIITNRNCKWPFFSDRVKVYDFAEIFHGVDKQRATLHNLKAIREYIKYRRYLYRIDMVVRRIVAGEDFVFYMPSMALDMTAAFATNKHCRGHYYIDEGSIAYLPPEARSPQEYYFPEEIRPYGFVALAKNVIKRLLRIEDHCHYEIYDPLFKGTVSITDKAFQWNINKERIINPKEDCVLELRESVTAFDDVIVTGDLRENINIIKKGIDDTIIYIMGGKEDSRIGIKFHPNAVTYNREQTMSIIEYIREKYDGRVSIIPREVSIEVMSLVYHPRLFSLFSLSSLLLYGLLFDSSKGYYINNDKDFSMVQISTVEEYYNIVRKVSNPGN